MSERLTHLDPDSGMPRMVEVGGKAVTDREATASCTITLTEAVFAQLKGGELQLKKGPVFQTAIIAGTQAVKRTADLIPFCHPLPLTGIAFAIDPDSANGQAVIRCTVRATWKTGVEMEALTGATVAALTVYDMCKALSHDLVIGPARLEAKTGGKQDFSREA
ncbi:MAG: cyclic pyranopterin monophosphate synthase MoaC [Opitutales bacterium]